MASPVIDLNKRNLIPLSLTSLCPCHFHSPSSQTLIFSTPSLPNLFLNGSTAIFPIPRGKFVNHHRITTAVAKSKFDSIDDGEEVKKAYSSLKKGNSALEHQQKLSQMKTRVIFGFGIGVSVGGVVLAGGWVFTVALAAAVFVGAREYFMLVRSRGISAGMTPPPRFVSRVCSVICALMPIVTL